MNPIITAEGLGKKYKVYSSKRKRISEWLTNRKKHDEKWVLRDVSFTLNKGESLGLVGSNGAGKSTLLKLLTGVTKPSEGTIGISGRFAALLELGMGFHPEFTGRQNIYITGQLLGLSNEEISRLMPEIEDFAEVGDYIDRPLKIYSSGMAVRVAFAAATAVRPDILIVDEALSVGDAYFQHKCFHRIRNFKEQGTSLLFVSHDASAVKNLCDKAILLDKGTLVKEGRPEEILDYYNAVIAQQEANYLIKQSQGLGERITTRSGNGSAEIIDVQVIANGELTNAVQVGQVIQIDVSIRFSETVNNPTIGILIKDRLGNDIFGTNTFFQQLDAGVCIENSIYKVSFIVTVNLGPGHYSLTTAIHNGSNHIQGNYDWWDHSVILEVLPGTENYFIGSSYMPVQCSISEVNANEVVKNEA